jgi:uncharacterized protein GlcG (DUF336 family)
LLAGSPVFGQTVEKKTLTLDGAERVLAAGRAKAQEVRAQGGAIAVVNTGGQFAFADSRKPADVEKSDVDRLRERSWNDAAIRETSLVVFLYACANRFSVGIGLVADF